MKNLMNAARVSHRSFNMNSTVSFRNSIFLCTVCMRAVQIGGACSGRWLYLYETDISQLRNFEKIPQIDKLHVGFDHVP